MRKCLILISLIISSVCYGGFRVGSGGDIVLCENYSSKYDKSQLYTLDYLIALSDKKFPRLSPAKITTLSSSLERVYSALKGTGLEGSFQFFASLVGNFRHRGYRRWWHVTNLPLFDIKDESFSTKLPRHCYGKDGALRKYQAIIRYRNTQKLIYDVQGFVMEAMKKANVFSPLQTSFLYVHEWLWDLTLDVRVVRRLNWLLHSQEFARLSPVRKKQELMKNGLSFPLPPLYSHARGRLNATIYRSFDMDKMLYVKAHYKNDKVKDAQYLIVMPVIHRDNRYCIDTRTSSRHILPNRKKNSLGFSVFSHENFGEIHRVHSSSFHYSKIGNSREYEFVGYPYRSMLDIKACHF